MVRDAAQGARLLAVRANIDTMSSEFHRAAPIERNTVSLGQQSTFKPAFFW
jgi:hypothetical protein